jgi:L-lactate dehydrogenase
MTEAGRFPDRVAIIGAGHVGSTAAYALMLRALFREIVLIDDDAARATAEARDIADANALARPVRVWAGRYAEAASASIAIITAGAATHGDETRLSVATRSAAIVRSCVTALSAAGFNGIILVASNPVDLMSMVAFDCAGLPANRIFGTGTLLDTSRLRSSLAATLNVSAGAVDALILGEHGDSEVAIMSSARVGGVALAEFSGTAREIDQAELARVVRDAAYEIIAGKGYTSFGVATAIVRICEAIVRDEKVVLPVSSHLDGVLGLSGLYMSMPCILGAGGIERVLVPVTSAEETAALAASGAMLREAFDRMQQDLPQGDAGPAL